MSKYVNTDYMKELAADLDEAGYHGTADDLLQAAESIDYLKRVVFDLVEAHQDSYDGQPISAEFDKALTGAHIALFNMGVKDAAGHIIDQRFMKGAKS